MLPTELHDEGEHLLTVCNACRYCEGHCAVWQAMERHLVFTDTDMNYLANLCHHCGECLYTCQYSPPHPFAIDAPKTLEKIRAASYEHYAWPGAVATAFRQANGPRVAVLTVAVLVVLLVIAGGQTLGQVGVLRASLAAALIATVASAVGFLRFWSTLDEPYSHLVDRAALWRAGSYIMRLDRSASVHGSAWLRHWHHLTFFSFVVCVVGALLGAIYPHPVGWDSGYGIHSWPVIIGSLGDIGLVVGCIGLLVVQQLRHRHPVQESGYGMDTAMTVLLLLIGGSGLLLDIFHDSLAIGSLVAFHLSFVIALFLTFPYGRLAHGVYWAAAVLKWELERSRPLSF
jgi:citrate/tricarballylate utilization protein